MTEAATIEDLLTTQLAGPEFHMFALGLFAFVAVLLAGVGVLGVLGRWAMRIDPVVLLRSESAHGVSGFEVAWP